MPKNNWSRIGKARRAGILVPLFSVYSGDSTGIGDFNDLKLLIDLCVKTGNSILQLLPMNETGSTFCPYDAVSSFALEPAYISMKDSAAARRLKKEYPAGKGHVDYLIKDAKMASLKKEFQKKADLNSKELKKFIVRNGYWLDDFALFKALKEHHSLRPWYEWEDRYKNRDADELNRFRREHEEDIIFYKWIQWAAFNQFKQAKSYAESKKVLIKGDLPILISRDSADVWAHPEFFKLDLSAGAPPDMYCAKGQRWGMPTYNWEKIASDGCIYLKEKLRYAENFYDILRVDHVVGLFRIWSIPYNDPAENMGLNGFFDPGDEKVWSEHGRRLIYAMFESTEMLLCAEDLGIIPRVCPETLKDLDIPGNDVQRWAKDWVKRHDFLKPEEYRQMAVAMLSTHDTTNWAAWWENEAGTVDEALFMRKCAERGIDYNSVKERLFDSEMSRHGRLRWHGNIDSANVLAGILGRRAEELSDFIDMYENTYKEKEKLWGHLGMKGAMREQCDGALLKAAFETTMNSRSVFCIELLMDYMFLGGFFKGDAYNYRINRPGTVAKENWSLVMPLSLEELLKDGICKEIKNMAESGKRI